MARSEYPGTEENNSEPLSLKQLGLMSMSLDTDPVVGDTTLMDGLQMPGLTASPEDVAQIAELLEQIARAKASFVKQRGH